MHAACLCRFLLTHIKELGYIANESVAALDLLAQEPCVLLLDHSTPTLIALQQMREQGISAAAIEAPGNSLIANLSMSDLRCCLWRRSYSSFQPGTSEEEEFDTEPLTCLWHVTDKASCTIVTVGRCLCAYPNHC